MHRFSVFIFERACVYEVAFGGIQWSVSGIGIGMAGTVSTQDLFVPLGITFAEDLGSRMAVQ